MKFLNSIRLSFLLCFPFALSALDYCPPQYELPEAENFLAAFELPDPGEISTSRGKLPTNWAQQLTGSDLVSVTGRRGRVGLIDTHKDHHFEAVSTVFENSSRGADVVFEASWEELSNFETFRRKVDAAKAAGDLPRFIGISYAMGSDPEVRRSLEYLQSSGSQIIASSGNKGDQELHPNNRLEGILNVGSVASNGLADTYSQSASIFAPVGDELLTQMNGQSFMVGGTSYAQPQVLAAFGDVDAILPGVTEEEILFLMNQTALQGVNGPILNHYKMVEVAKKLKAKAWPANRHEIQNKNSDIYDFDSKIQALLAENAGSSLANLRAAFLLEPTDESLRQELVTAYRNQGLGAMAQYFESLSTRPGAQESYVQQLAQSSDPKIRQQAQRSLRLLGEEGEAVWANLLAQGTAYEKRESLSSLSQVPSRILSAELQDALAKSLEDEAPSTQVLAWMAVEKHALSFHDDPQLLPWESAWKHPQSEVRQSAVIAARAFPYMRSFPSFHEDENPSVRRQALFTASVFPEPFTSAYASTFQQDPEPGVRAMTEAILVSESEQDDPFSPFVVRSFARPDPAGRGRMLDLYFQYKVFYEAQPVPLRPLRAKEELYRRLAGERDIEIISASLESLMRLGQNPEQIQEALRALTPDAAWRKQVQQILAARLK